MIYPFDGKFIDISGDILAKAIENLSVETLKETDGSLTHPSSLGGVVMWNKSKFMQVGMENENFVSWGYEDNERLCRAMKLGVKVARADGCLFHMHHPVSQNSSNTKHKAYQDNQREFMKVNQMSTLELLKYIGSWSWMQ
jgi:predicted glycosyltransferase involved in capsule biosynthesis